MGRASEARKNARNNIKKAQNKKKPDTKKKKDTKKKTLGEKLKPLLEGAGKLADTGVVGKFGEMSKGVSTGPGDAVRQGSPMEDDAIVSKYNAEYLKASKDIEKMYPI